MLEGNLEALRLPNTVVIDELATQRLSPVKGGRLKIGDQFEINDIEARVVGICDADRSFTGGPYVWTIYERALQYSPPQRKMLSAVIAAPVEGVAPLEAAREIQRVTGLRAFVTGNSGGEEENFGWSTIWWYIRNTGIPISFGTTVIVGFIVGVAIACQTFYAFVLDNLRYLGALKAMGMSTPRLSAMSARYPLKPKSRARKPFRFASRAATVQSAAPCGMPKATSATMNGHGAARAVSAGSAAPSASAAASTSHGSARGPKTTLPAPAAGGDTSRGVARAAADDGEAFTTGKPLCYAWAAWDFDS
jgi:hypothetical protein